MSTKGLAPGRIGPLALRNRIIKTGAFENMCPGGHPSADLVAHHGRMAEGGVGLTTVAYAAVEAAGRTFDQQMVLDADRVKPLRDLTAAVHRHGGAASVQLAHCGGFSRMTGPDGRAPMGPSAGWNRYGLALGVPRVRAMDEGDLARVRRAYVDAALHAEAAGFDAVELHMGHGYLLSQFLSPLFNGRRDTYGGDPQGRLRYPLEVLDAVLDAVGDRLAVLVKTNLHDGARGGLGADEALEVHRRLDSAGAHALVMSGGLVSHTPFYLMRGTTPWREMAAAEHSPLMRWAMRVAAPFVLQTYAFEPLFFRELAQGVRSEIDGILVLLGGVTSAADVDAAMGDGFDFVAVGRTLIHDPDWVHKLAAGEAAMSGCTHCNLCVVEIERGPVRCMI